ncbi:protein-disulfide reductase DsbD domain-containing protein [Pseudaestuariivita rosea]|uniref:protein-disulfide reductase DsbD domain-containing protein n=1 Tax=Pseudaestuariivita rosea TaxID=2763263 RepID=UPI001ABB9F61|nr:protein-disulfide reductase DsbD domain-containing protein [Pseudaestuariivita rosea]
MIRAAAISLFLCIATFARAESLDDVIKADVLSGWRTAEGTHMAGLRLTMAPGWKTYWRAPGDAGIPPTFSWRGSRNLRAVDVLWPVPQVHDQDGFRTFGYSDVVVIPIKLTPDRQNNIRLRGSVDLGVCKDVCIPATLKFRASLPNDGQKDPEVFAALLDLPLTAKEADVRDVTCRIAPTADGLELMTQIRMPYVGNDPGEEIAVVEANNSDIWISEASTDRKGDMLTVKVEMQSDSGGPIMLDRSTLRFTVIRRTASVDIHGCKAG